MTPSIEKDLSQEIEMKRHSDRNDEGLKRL